MAKSAKAQSNPVRQPDALRQRSRPALDLMDSVDQRRHPRSAVEGYAEVCLPQGGLLFRGSILNISASGCYIEASSLNLSVERMSRSTLLRTSYPFACLAS